MSTVVALVFGVLLYAAGQWPAAFVLFAVIPITYAGVWLYRRAWYRLRGRERTGDGAGP